MVDETAPAKALNVCGILVSQRAAAEQPNQQTLL
jgi:hypothetical protein